MGMDETNNESELLDYEIAGIMTENADNITIDNEKTDNFESFVFTVKTKGFWSLGAVAFSLIWVILWKLFPMEWYAVFFDNTIGSVIQLSLLAAVLSVIMCFPASKITKTDIPFFGTLISNILSLVVIDYIYAIFQADMFFVVIIAWLIHIGINILFFSKALFYDKDEKLTPIKKQRAITLFTAVLYTCILDISNILLFRLITYIYFTQ